MRKLGGLVDHRALRTLIFIEHQVPYRTLHVLKNTKNQKMSNEEHLEYQESHVPCMALPEAIDKPTLAKLI